MARPVVGKKIEVRLPDEDRLWIARMAGATGLSIPDTIRLIIKGARQNFSTTPKEDTES